MSFKENLGPNGTGKKTSSQTQLEFKKGGTAVKVKRRKKSSIKVA